MRDKREKGERSSFTDSLSIIIQQRWPSPGPGRPSQFKRSIIEVSRRTHIVLSFPPTVPLSQGGRSERKLGMFSRFWLIMSCGTPRLFVLFRLSRSRKKGAWRFINCFISRSFPLESLHPLSWPQEENPVNGMFECGKASRKRDEGASRTLDE